MDGVLKTMKENANKAKSLLLTTIPQIGSMEWSETLRNLKVSGLTPVSRHVCGSNHLSPGFHFEFGPSPCVVYTRQLVLFSANFHALSTVPSPSPESAQTWGESFVA